MTPGKTLLLVSGVVLAIGGGIGGTLGVMTLLPHHAPTVAVKIVPPKPIYFAELADVIVSVPADTGDPSSSFVQFAVEFSTYDQNAVGIFAELQPIIKSDVISLLMNETGKSLQNPATRASIVKNCLDISNSVLSRNGSYLPANPFKAAYITNLVVQD